MIRICMLVAFAIAVLVVVPTPAKGQACLTIPDPFPCEWVIWNLALDGTACPKGDIPYRSGLCDAPETDWLSLYSYSDQNWAYEYVEPATALCPSLPDFWGPTSSGIIVIQPSGCPSDVACNGNLAIRNIFTTKWCYSFRHWISVGSASGCEDHIDQIAVSNVDLVGGGSEGVVDASDLSAFASLIGTECGVSGGTGAHYTPVPDYNRDGKIDGTDLALFSAHFGHSCSQWAPSKGPQKLTTLSAYPWDIFDLPEMQVAMAAAGVDRDFIVRTWEENGPEQRLFVQAGGYNPGTHQAEVRAEAARSASAESRTWTTVKVLYR